MQTLSRKAVDLIGMLIHINRLLPLNHHCLCNNDVRMIHNCTYAVCTCVCYCYIPFKRIKQGASVAWRKTGSLVKGDAARRACLTATPPDLGEKATADLPQLELDYQPIPLKTLVNGGRREVGEGEKSVGNDNGWQLSPLGSIGGTPPEEDVRRNFEGCDETDAKAIGFTIKARHAQERSSYLPRFFSLFSSSKCLFIVLAHKQDRQPMAKTNRVKLWRSDKQTLCKRECPARLGCLAHR